MIFTVLKSIKSGAVLMILLVRKVTTKVNWYNTKRRTLMLSVNSLSMATKTTRTIGTLSKSRSSTMNKECIVGRTGPELHGH